MADTKSYEFSRIFRQGWNAAKKRVADGEGSDASDKTALNPYTSAAERERWTEGFDQALSSPDKSYNTPGGNTWRPAKMKRDF
jgi:hypothetical protein